MEQFRIRVLEIQTKGELVKAKVRAITKRRIAGKPAASIHLHVHLEVIPGEKPKATSERAFNESLMFLDL